MISIWHLLWIMPLSGMAGFMMAALCAAASDRRSYNEKQTVVDD
jgi:hypothetical protein